MYHVLLILSHLDHRHESQLRQSLQLQGNDSTVIFRSNYNTIEVELAAGYIDLRRRRHLFVSVADFSPTTLPPISDQIVYMSHHCLIDFIKQGLLGHFLGAHLGLRPQHYGSPLASDPAPLSNEDRPNQHPSCRHS
jgi:hypothetical protein